MDQAADQADAKRQNSILQSVKFRFDERGHIFDSILSSTFRSLSEQTFMRYQGTRINRTMGVLPVKKVFLADV